MQVTPAILENDVGEVAEKLAIVTADGNFKVVQLDVADGQLTDSLTVTPLDLSLVNWGDLKVDFHLMTEEPLDYVWEIAAQEPALPVRAVYGQVERMGEQTAFLRAVRERGWTAGLALDIETPVDSIRESAWAEIDEILLLAVPMGSQGRTFDSEVLVKVKELQEEIAGRGLAIKIGVDGGIKPAQLKELQTVGVDMVVIGSFLWAGEFEQQEAAINKVEQEKED